MKIFTEEFMGPLFELLERTQNVTQMEIHHPEIYVFNHSTQTLKWAFRETNDTDLILAAMLHDIGKIEDSKGHEKIGSEMVKDYVSFKTRWLIEQHMRVWDYILGNMKKLSKVNELAEHPWFPELIQLARWDKLGRKKNASIYYERGTILKKLNKAAEKHFFVPNGYSKDEVNKKEINNVHKTQTFIRRNS